MVNHHQTTIIWENMFDFFQESEAHPSIYIYTCLNLPNYEIIHNSTPPIPTNLHVRLFFWTLAKNMFRKISINIEPQHIHFCRWQFFGSKSPKSGSYWFPLGFLHPEWKTTMTQPTSQTFLTISGPDNFTTVTDLTTRQKISRVFCFFQEWRLSVSMVPCRDLEPTVKRCFFCVLNPSFPPVQGGVTLVVFFSKECHRPDLCGCFLLSLWGIEEITHLFTSFLIGIIFLVVKTMVSCFLSLQQIFLWSLESRPMNMVCVSVCQKFFYLHRFF